MSNTDQNFPKVMGEVCHRPPKRIGIPFLLGLLIKRVLYLIGCSLGIVLSGLQWRQRWWGLGWGGNWGQSLGTGFLISSIGTEGGIWVDEW